jgi:hypothetical protein
VGKFEQSATWGACGSPTHILLPLVLAHPRGKGMGGTMRDMELPNPTIKAIVIIIV